jgi:hypothetical protein
MIIKTTTIIIFCFVFGAKHKGDSVQRGQAVTAPGTRAVQEVGRDYGGRVLIGQALGMPKAMPKAGRHLRSVSICHGFPPRPRCRRRQGYKKRECRYVNVGTVHHSVEVAKRIFR